MTTANPMELARPERFFSPLHPSPSGEGEGEGEGGRGALEA